MKKKQKEPACHCRICHIRLAKSDPDRDSSGQYHKTCLRKYESRRMKVLYLMALLLVLLPATLYADRPAPQLTCTRVSSADVRCEMKYVWPKIPSWKTSEHDYGQGYGEGFGMTMRLTEDWTTITMTMPSLTMELEARLYQGKAHFRKKS